MGELRARLVASGQGGREPQVVWPGTSGSQQPSSRGGREWRLELGLCTVLLLGSWGVRAGYGLEDAWTLRGLSLAGLPRL